MRKLERVRTILYSFLAVEATVVAGICIAAKLGGLL